MILPLECMAQKYAWGKVGLQSTVAQLVKEQGQEVDESAPYAELWMGTHPNGPSKVVLKDGSKIDLGEFLKDHPDVVGNGSNPASGLPYLFKILSVETALSIQAHPDKALAEQLFAERPNVYKDPNHKPEMACAITPFEALAGFLPLSEVVQNVLKTPELLALLKENEACAELFEDDSKLNPKDEDAEKRSLKIIFSALMTSKEDSVASAVEKLHSRLTAANASNSTIDNLVLRLISQYPGDVGIFCAYMMCYRVLEPGQAVFLGANEPHAYLAGDCAEIMACSDNVVRAGLTPKLRDVDTLISMLTYRQPAHSGAEFHPGNMLEGKSSGPNSLIYSPPDPAVTEFQMERVVVSKSDGNLSLEPSGFACIILVLSGSGNLTDDGRNFATSRGDIFLQGAGSESTISSNASEEIVLFRASLKGAF